MMARCATTTWRGKTVCVHSVAKLAAWAAATGSFYIKPIQGCYSTAVAASQNTHAGGGVYDVECDGYSTAEANAVCNAGRRVLLITFGRWWDGNHHIHLIDPSCPNLDPSAVEQVVQWKRGETGLVGPNDKDTWDRSTFDKIMVLFNNRNNTAPAPSKPVTPSIDTRMHVDYTMPYQRTAGWFPYPGAQGKSYYGPSSSGKPWYSGKTAGGAKEGVDASGGLRLNWIRGHIQRIQKVTGTRITSTYGVNTVNAVKIWQKRNGLPVDGIVGPKTWAAMAKSRKQGK
jgi:hypothetical protein